MIRAFTLLALAVLSTSACTQPPSISAELTSIERLKLQARGQGNAAAENALFNLADSGNIAAQRALGEVLIRRSDRSKVTEGVNWLQRAAMQGDVDAQLSLGKLYLEGRAPIARDVHKAREWFLPAARAGDARGAYYMGVMDAQGYGATPDAQRAAQWLVRAAEQGLPDAMFLLGNAYAAGDGVALNQTTAMQWYQRAAEREHPQALQQLAMAYRDGSNGLPRDEAEFEEHIVEIAHSLKHPHAKP